MTEITTDSLIDELRYLVELLNESLPGGTSSSAVLSAATSLMITRRLDLILAEAAREGGA